MDENSIKNQSLHLNSESGKRGETRKELPSFLSSITKFVSPHKSKMQIIISYVSGEFPSDRICNNFLVEPMNMCNHLSDQNDCYPLIRPPQKSHIPQMWTRVEHHPDCSIVQWIAFNPIIPIAGAACGKTVAERQIRVPLVGEGFSSPK